MAVDPDHVPGECRAHAPIFQRDQVSPHRQDLVTRRLDGVTRSSAVALNALARNLYTALRGGGRQASARWGSSSGVALRAHNRKPGSAALQLIQRGELLASLNRAAEAKVTLISAPAGSGKTSLLRAWADRPGLPYRLAVVPVRRDQQDSQQFWIAVLSAILQAHGASGEGEQPAATPDFNDRVIVDRIRAELAEHRDRTHLVIDDLHELTSPDALTQLTQLLETLPQHVHAILTTRRSLP